MIRRLVKLAAAGAAVFFVAGLTQADAQYAGLSGGPGAASAMPATPAARRVIPITKGKSASIDFDFDIRIGGTTNPAVADVRMVTPRRAVIMGVGYGQTDAQFYDAAGRMVMSVDVRVEQDISALDAAIARVAPDADVQTQSVNDNIILTGTVPNAATADKAVQMASIFAGSPEQVRNFLTITGNEQVTLKVQVVEVNRTALKQLGFNSRAVFGQAGMDQWILGNSPSYAVNGGYQGGFQGGYSLDTTTQALAVGPDDCSKSILVDHSNPAACVGTGRAGSTGTNQAIALLQAFERQGLVRTLAEPNLTAVSGEAAKFLAGGEYPVPSGRDQQGNVTVEFKPFGVGLGFTPVVLSGGRISLKISTEVSELSTQGALTLAGVAGSGSSTVIPALAVRRVENTIELPSGGSMMIAGLLQQQTRQNIDKIPGIGDIPVMGALARSRDYLNNESELVIIVTAYLTHPTGRDQLQTPADNLRVASDAETIFLGKLNSTYHAPPQANAGRTYEGPFGHVID